MLITSFLSWWYGLGYRMHILKIKRELAKLMDQFSILELITTLFSPFKQIDAGQARAQSSINDKFHIWLDRLFSRFFGAFIRFFTILAGLIIIVLTLIFDLIRIIGWPLLPIAPFVGLFLALVGWLPWK